MRAGRVLAAVLLLAAAAAGAQQAFFTAVSDLPLMAGLAEDPDDVLVFDNPGGRIVEVSATGDLSAIDVRAFYAATLPQLGWEALESDRYAREGEALTIAYAREGAVLRVRFSLAPHAGPAP